jgi:hypothetical protein
MVFGYDRCSSGLSKRGRLASSQPGSLRVSILWDGKIAVVLDRGDRLISAEENMICIKSGLGGSLHLLQIAKRKHTVSSR